MTTLKVIVTGMVTESFIGSEKEVEKYLTNLKKIQQNLVSPQDMKEYKKAVQKHSYYNPSCFVEEFRETYKTNGLSIKIERHVPKTDKFF